jgi:hypothetical protein
MSKLYIKYIKVTLMISLTFESTTKVADSGEAAYLYAYKYAFL